MTATTNSQWDILDDLQTDLVGFGEYTPDELESRIYVDLPGWYHLRIENAKWDSDPRDKNGKPTAKTLSLLCEVLHSVPGQSPAGTLFVHRLICSRDNGDPFNLEDEKDANKLRANITFLMGIGAAVVLDTPVGPRVGDPFTKSTRFDMARMAERMTNWQFLAKIEKNSWMANQFVEGVQQFDQRGNPVKEERTRYVISFGRNCFAWHDPKVKDRPKNLEATKLAANQPPAQAGSNTHPATSKGTNAVPPSDDIDI